MISAVSVKTRLKNRARETGSTMQDELVTFALERTIYRISASKYWENFTLKGGIFLYALFAGGYARATRDIDLLAQEINNNEDGIREVFREILSISCDDALRYDLESLDVKDITEFKEYHGVNVAVMAYLDRTRIPVSIDIGFGDVVYPQRIKMEFPVLLDMEVPEIYVYSVYSAIAEKFEAIVSLGYTNSRYKDFYDIYVLAEQYNLDGSKLQNAIMETFSHRKTGYDDIVIFEPEFAENKARQMRWDAFIKKKKANIRVGFPEVMQVICYLFQPIAAAIASDHTYHAIWENSSGNWKLCHEKDCHIAADIC